MVEHTDEAPSLVKQSKQYLADLALKVSRIEDDILGEKLDVEIQLVSVSSSGADCRYFKLADLEACIPLKHGMSWELCKVGDLKVGDIIRSGYESDHTVSLGKITKITLWGPGCGVKYFDVLLPDGTTTEAQTYSLDFLKASDSLDLEECSRLADVGIMWEPKPQDWIKVGDIIRNEGLGIALGKVVTKVADNVVLLLPDGTKRAFDWTYGLNMFVAIAKVNAGICSEAWKSVSDASDAALAVLENTDPVLVVSGPGTGKTFFMQQICYRIVSILSNSEASHDTLLPVLIPIQKMARIWRQKKHILEEEPEEGLISFFEVEYPQYCTLLSSKLKAGQLVLLIDGVDEAAGMRKRVEALVHEFIIPSGNRVILTSRPEGIRLPLYFRDFQIMNLLPLSTDHQLQVIKKFLSNDEFLASLVKLMDVRRGHDEVYQKNFDSEQRQYMESLEPSDRFKLPNGEWNAAARQKALDGFDLSKTETINSCLLQEIQEKLKESNFLIQLESELQNYITSGQQLKHADAETAVDRIIGKHPRNSEFRKVCVRFCLLWANSQYRTLNPPQLWDEIVSRTDALYVSAEHFKLIFENTVTFLKKQFSDDEIKIQMGGIKDPIRVFEKANNDYSERFRDGLAESCVADIWRVRLICKTVKTMHQLLKILQKDQQVASHVDNGSSIIRLKNMFHLTQIGPTHMRFVILSLQLSDGAARFLTEVQVQHEAILDYEASADGHTTYEYFRSALKDRYHTYLEKVLQAPQIEDMLSRFEEMAKVPVLLSLIVVIIREGDRENPFAALQLGKFELYETAMKCLIQHAIGDAATELVTEMLMRISAENMRAQRRIFDDDDVCRALGGDECAAELLEKWSTLQASSSGVPLVKTLSVPSQSQGGDGRGEYQFKHLSFCEAFYFKYLTRSGSKIASEESLKVITDTFYKNVNSFGPWEICQLLNWQDYLPLDEMSPEGFQLLRSAIEANSCKVESIFGVFVGNSDVVSVSVAPDDHNIHTKSSTSERYPEVSETRYYKCSTPRTLGYDNCSKIVGGDGILFAMVNGDLERVRTLVSKNGNLHIKRDIDIYQMGGDRKILKEKAQSRDFTIRSGMYFRMVDGFKIHKNDTWYWDGISEPHDASNLLELAIASLQLDVARAIQDGMLERGDKCQIQTGRLFKLIQTGVDRHSKARAYKVAERSMSKASMSSEESIGAHVSSSAPHLPKAPCCSICRLCSCISSQWFKFMNK